MGSILHTPEGTRRKASSSWGCPSWGPQRNFHRQPLTQLVSTTEYLLCDRVVFISLIPITKHLANLNKGKVCFGTQFNGTICTVGKSLWQKCQITGSRSLYTNSQEADSYGCWDSAGLLLLFRLGPQLMEWYYPPSAQSRNTITGKNISLSPRWC